MIQVCNLKCGDFMDFFIILAFNLEVLINVCMLLLLQMLDYNVPGGENRNVVPFYI